MVLKFLGRKQKREKIETVSGRGPALNVGSLRRAESLQGPLEELAVTLGQLQLSSPKETALAVQKRGPSKPYLIYISDVPNAFETDRCLREKVQQSYLAHSIGHPTHGHLTTIVHFNVFHGLARNAALLGIQNEWLIKGTTSPFTHSDASHSKNPSCPENMRPTALQRTTPHHPWIDLWPLPRMRNNFLAASLHTRGTVDEDAMCRDIVDVGAGEGIEEAALVVWGDAWDPKSWEVTEGFLRKWGWLLEGCGELIEATNAWRKRRGERPFRLVLV